MALAAIADDGDLLALDQIDIGIAIVIDPHGLLFPCSRGVLRAPDYARAVQLLPTPQKNGATFDT